MDELLKLFISFFKVGALSFGGAYSLIPVIESEIVIRHTWLTADEFLKVLGNKLWSIVRDYPRLGIRISFLDSLKDYLNIALGHRFPQLPMDYIPTAPVKNTAQVIKRAANIDMRNINMPMLMRSERLLKACALFRCPGVPPFQQSGIT